MLLKRHKTGQNQCACVEAKAMGPDRDSRKLQVQCVDVNGREFVIEYDHLIGQSPHSLLIQ